MTKVEIVRVDKKKNEVSYNKIFRIFFFIFVSLGTCCLFANIIYTGPYNYGDDSTLFIIGLLSIIIGIQMDQYRK